MPDLFFLPYFEYGMGPTIATVPACGDRKRLVIKPIEVRSFPSVREASAKVRTIGVNSQGHSIPVIDYSPGFQLFPEVLDSPGEEKYPLGVRADYSVAEIGQSILLGYFRHEILCLGNSQNQLGVSCLQVDQTQAIIVWPNLILPSLLTRSGVPIIRTAKPETGVIDTHRPLTIPVHSAYRIRDYPFLTRLPIQDHSHEMAVTAIVERAKPIFPWQPMKHRGLLEIPAGSL